MSDDLKKNMKKDFDVAKDRMRNIDFQVDTLGTKTRTGGYYDSGTNSITVNYVEGDDTFNKWSKSASVLIHEQKHRDNNTQGMYRYAVSAEQVFKLNVHDEISANIVSLIYLREEYLRTGDISVFDEESKRYKFYVDAIKNGEIDPFSSYKENFDKEMSLIVNGTRDMWVRHFGNSYFDEHIYKAELLGDRIKQRAMFYDQNYERAKKIIYTIGGVDFTEYMDKDVEVPERGKKKVLTSKQLFDEGILPRYDGKMSLMQYQNLLQHALVMRDEEVGINSQARSKGDGQTTKGKSNLDKLAYCYLTEGKLSDEAQKKYKEALDDLSKNDRRLVNDIIYEIAYDYQKRGDLLPQGDDKAYNDAVDKLYTGYVKFDQDDLKFEGEVNLREAFNPYDVLVMKELSGNSQSIQQRLENMNVWERMGRQNEYLKESLNEKFGLRLKEQDDVKNDPVNEFLEVGTPEYEKWSKNKRVSPVQNVQMLNLMADVIERPTEGYGGDKVLGRSASCDREALKKDMQNEAKEKARMIKVIVGFNRLHGDKGALDVGKTVKTLYDKFGDNAYELLTKAVNEPSSLAKDIGDSTIRTSSDAVRSLCDVDDKKKNAVINSVLMTKER